MLFLRDIQVDIQMRCRVCGHEGVLARPDLERRFGPNYPVLSIAPHYRCSRCNSKDVESRPAPESRAAMAPLHDEDQRSPFDAAMAALQGLVHAVRGDAPERDAAAEPARTLAREEEPVIDLMGDDMFATLMEDPPAEDEDKGENEDEDPDVWAIDAPEPAAVPVATGIEDADGETGVEPPPAGLDETLAAPRALTLGDEDEDAAEPCALADGDDDGWPEDEVVDSGVADETDDLPEDLDEIPDEEILSFAIRDREFGRADEAGDDEAGDDEADPEPAPVFDLDRYAEPEPKPEPAPRARRARPEAGSLDGSLAALRALVEKAAAEEPEPADADRAATPDEDPGESDEPADEDTLDENEPAEDAPAEDEPATDDLPPRMTAQEKSLEETLAQLRGMLDLDGLSGDEGEPVIKPRRR